MRREDARCSISGAEPEVPTTGNGLRGSCYVAPCEFSGVVSTRDLRIGLPSGWDVAEFKLCTKRDTLLPVYFRPRITPFLRCSEVHALSFVTSA